MAENFKNFELRFNDNDFPETERADFYKKPLLEISTLLSAMPEEALQVI